jgi:hypothetical protein
LDDFLLLDLSRDDDDDIDDDNDIDNNMDMDDTLDHTNTTNTTLDDSTLHHTIYISQDPKDDANHNQVEMASMP